MRVSKKFTVVLGALFGLLLLGGIVESRAGSIKNWVTGEVIRSQDLNNNFNHIHNSMVGGHGARLVDSDVSSSAAISISKLSTPALIPKAWVQVGADCTASPCTITSSSGVSTVTWNSAGNMSVAWSTPRPNGSYVVLCSCLKSGAQSACTINNQTTNGVSVVCYAAAVATNAGLNVLMLDDN